MRRIRAAPRVWRAWVLLVGVLGLNCRDAIGPGSLSGHLAFAPAFESSAAGIVDFDRARITVARPPSIEVLDTLITIPATEDSIDLSLSVPLLSSREDLLLYLRLINAAGDTVFRNTPYPQSITVTSGRSGSVVPAPIAYVGVGYDAVAVVIGSPDTSVLFGETLSLNATAWGPSEQTIPGTPVVWRSLDSTRVQVPSRALGEVVGGTQRGAARIVAELLTGPADTVLVTAQPLPSQLQIAGGDGQEGPPGGVLALPLRVRVTAADGLGVRVPVSFRATAAGARVADALLMSDADGYAQTVATLGSTSGTQSFEAVVAGLPPVVITANAVVAGPASQLAFVTQPGDGFGGVVLPTVVVAIQDQFGKRVSTWTDPVVVSLGPNNPLGAKLLGTTAVDAVDGLASFSDLTVDLPGLAYTLVVSSGVLPPQESTPFDVSIAPGVVFAGDSSAGLSSGVFGVNPDGSNRRRLTDQGKSGDVHPRSSPDRQRVAFTYDEQANGRNVLFVVSRFGDTLVTVVTDTSARRPRWSPDGKNLAFECGNGSGIQQDVCVIPDVTGPITGLNRRGDATGKFFVTDFDRDKIDGPAAFAWDPLDPRMLVVVRDSVTDKAEVISRLYRVTFDGQLVQPPLSSWLFDPVSLRPLRIVGTLDWSADGSTIVFAAQDPLAFDAQFPTGQRLYAIAKDGSGLRELTKGPAFDYQPVVSPDGTQVLFFRGLGCSVDYWRIDIAVSGETQVSNEGWCDFSHAVLGHDWSPDGRDIVLVGSEPLGNLGNFAIYRIPAGTTATTYDKRVLIGRGVDLGGFVHDIQPSWRP